VATGGYNLSMYISIKDFKNQLSDLVHRAEGGETIIVTRHGKAVAEIGPPKKMKGGIDFEAGKRFMEEHNIDRIITYIAPDFDDPLPEDFLTTPITFLDETA
jgi:prevent-host-death family protein